MWRWLLPDWTSDKSPSARDIAKAAAEMGVSYVLVTGIVLPDQFIENARAVFECVKGDSAVGKVVFTRVDQPDFGIEDAVNVQLVPLQSWRGMSSVTTRRSIFTTRSMPKG